MNSNEEVKENSSDEKMEVQDITEYIRCMLNKKSEESKKAKKVNQAFYSINFINDYWNSYKTQPCIRFINGLSCPCPVMCPGYHNAQDRRRNPATHCYSKKACRNVKCPMTKKWGNYEEKCIDSCPYSHHRFEQMYHPSCFRSVPCLRYPDCDYGDFCSHLHPDHTSIPCIAMTNQNQSNSTDDIISDKKNGNKSIIPSSVNTPLISHVNTPLISQVNTSKSNENTLFPISLNAHYKRTEKPKKSTEQNKESNLRTSLFNEVNYFESVKENVPPRKPKNKKACMQENDRRYDLNKLLEKIG